MPIADCEEPDVAKFMDVHNGFVGVTELQLREARERDLAAETAEGVHFEHAWLDPESGRVFCLSSGPSKEAVRRVHHQAGTPSRKSTSCRSRSDSHPGGRAGPHRSGRIPGHAEGANP